MNAESVEGLGFSINGVNYLPSNVMPGHSHSFYLPPEHCRGKDFRAGRYENVQTKAVRAFQVVPVVKNPSANAGDARDQGLIPGSVGKIPWGRKLHRTPVFLPGESPWIQMPPLCWSWGYLTYHSRI